MSKCPSALWVPYECPGAQVSSECSSAWVPFESPLSVKRNFKLDLTLLLNKKYSSEMAFKQIIIRFLGNSRICFTLRLYIFQSKEKQRKIFLYINNTLWDNETADFLELWGIRGFFLSWRRSGCFLQIIFFRQKYFFHNGLCEKLLFLCMGRALVGGGWSARCRRDRAVQW